MEIDRRKALKMLREGNYIWVHICSNGKIRDYGSLLCSACRPPHCLNFIVDKDELEEYRQAQREL